MRNMYSVHDKKAETWSFPFQSENNSTAMRDFETLVHDGRTIVGQHPEDFDLYFIGQFYLETGTVRSDMPVHLVNGADFHTGEK